MTKLLATLMLALLCCAAAAATCQDAITGYSATFGKRNTAQLDRFNNQTAQWQAKGNITKVNAYYNSTLKCVLGLKVTYGGLAANALLLGMEKSLSTRDLALLSGEYFNKVQAKAASCIEYVRLVTNLGHELTIGNSASSTATITAYPNKATGYLATIRGYEAYTAGTGGTTVRGPMRTLQFVWGNNNCSATATTTAAVPAPSPSPSPAPAAPTPATPPTCPAKLDSCAASASISSAAYCAVVSPFIKSTCMGGCCWSSGKCTSSSCAISGVGKEVSNTICYSISLSAAVIGASPNCAGLACKLAVPGCTSDLLGGSCVGTVVDLSGTANTTNPAGAALVGLPCLDVTPSDTTLNADGTESTSGAYVAKLWSVCDCSAVATIGDTSLSLPMVGKLNYTDIKSLISALIPGNDTHPLQTVLTAVKSQIPSLILPEKPALNLTNALAFIGSLVGKSSGAASAAEAAAPLTSVLNLVKGASALATASNSSNPLGSILGALAPKTSSGSTNPLAGLSNLVSALSPSSANTTTKASILSRILSGLSGGTGAAPAADLISTVSDLLSGGTSGSGSGLDFSTVLHAFHLPNKTVNFITTVEDAVSLGKQAASGSIDFATIASKLGQFLGGSSATASGTSKLSSVISGLESLAGLTGSGSSATNPLAFLSSIAANKTGGLASFMNVVNTASKLAPALQSLSSAAASGSGPLASVLQLVEGGSGIDLTNVASMASKISPILQALGGGSSSGSGSGTTTSSSSSSSSPLTTLINAAKTLSGSSSPSSSSGGGSFSLSDLSNLVSTMQKVAPVLQALSGSGSSGSSVLTGLQSFLDVFKGSASG